MANAQSKFTISGSIKDADTGEDLPGVNIYLKSNQQKGTVSNYYGFYSLTLVQKNYVLRFDFLGYENKEISVNLSKNIVIDIRLKPTEESLSEVVIRGKNKIRMMKYCINNCRS